MKLIENSKKKPLRIFVQVSQNDLRANDPEGTHHNWVMANERTARALGEKGYEYSYVFSLGTGHCDSRVAILNSLAGIGAAGFYFLVT